MQITYFSSLERDGQKLNRHIKLWTVEWLYYGRMVTLISYAKESLTDGWDYSNNDE